MSYQPKNHRTFINIPLFLAITLFLASSWTGLLTSSWGQPAGAGQPAELQINKQINKQIKNPLERSTVRAGRWMAGDFHQHTLYSDGSFSMSEVMSNGFHFGLDWLANSDHGGTSKLNENEIYWDDPSLNVTFLGDETSDDGHRLMWRWQNLRDYAYPMVVAQRAANPDKLIALGLEWNIPGHEHCLVGIIASDGQPISDFEYKFDRMDKDTSRSLPKQNDSPLYTILDPDAYSSTVAVAAAAWLQANYRYTSWLIPSHPERVDSYDIADFRDFNNASPDVSFGFEGMPGHQKAKIRGDFCVQSDGGDTYGGAGCYIAKVGGLWDALLGEGRVWSAFADSDFHRTDRDFWPGEYSKNYTFVQDENGDGKYSLKEVVDGLRSGDSFCVLGDLINALDFQMQAVAGSGAATGSGSESVANPGSGSVANPGPVNTSLSARGLTSGEIPVFMGQTLHAAKGDRLLITIRFKSPQVNSHGDAIRVDHVDLIAGEVTGKVNPGDQKAYHNATNQSTRVIARFTKQDWNDEDGWHVIGYTLGDIEKDMYFRLRGTNLGLGVDDETDREGNPLMDPIIDSDDGKAPWGDLWFYSNAIFVDVREPEIRSQGIKSRGQKAGIRSQQSLLTSLP